MMLARALAVAVGEKTESSAVRNWAWRGFLGYVLPGAVITVITGLYQILGGGGFAFYFAQDWFHGKVTLVLLMIGATVLFGIKTKAMSRGATVSKGVMMAIHGIAGLMLIGGVLLTVLGRS